MLRDNSELLGNIDALLAEEQAPMLPTQTITEYCTALPCTKEQAVEKLKGVLVRATKQYGARPTFGTSSVLGFPNGARMCVRPSSHIEFTTPVHTNPHELALDEMTGDMIAGELPAYYAGNLTVYKRTGWEHTEKPDSAGYIKRLAVDTEAVVQLVGDPSRQNFLATWGAVNPLVFGRGIIGRVNEAKNRPYGFRFSQREDGIGSVDVGTAKVTTHGKKPSSQVELSRDTGYFNYLGDDPVSSSRIATLALAASDLMLRLATSERFGQLDIPLLADPLQALHDVSADLTLSRAYELVDGTTMTALEILQQIGETTLRLAVFEPVPSEAHKVAELLVSLPDTLRASNIPEGDLNGLDEQLPWALKYRFLFQRVANKDLRLLSVDYAGAAGADLYFDVPAGKGTQLWNKLKPDAGATPEALKQRLMQPKAA